MRKLVVAVSGGVDSMVMLDKLFKSNRFDLIVAHVNHGIRPDADKDELLVKTTAESLGLQFVSTRLKLGPTASEQLARDKRHQFLAQVKLDCDSSQIATAHHLDDVVETIILNFMRGTGWRGLCSLRQTNDIKRPLLDMRKADIIRYAIEHGLNWREDSTNDNVALMRNYIRHLLVPKLAAAEFNKIVKLWQDQVKLRQEIDQELASLPNLDQLSRRQLAKLQDNLAAEVLRAWLDKNYQTATYQRLIKFNQTANKGKKFNLPGNKMILATTEALVAINAQKK